MTITRRRSTLARNWLSALIDPRRLLGLIHLPRYLADWRRYRRLAGPDAPSWSESYPCLADWLPYTPFDPHYYYQAGWAARKLAEARPRWHVDIGSSVLLTAVTSAMVPTVFVDYRPLQSRLTQLANMGGDLLALPFASDSLVSLSCLHVIEHIGLGRYGDPVDPAGSLKAARELVRVLAPAGRLLFSTPVGRERIQFNAHRIFAPESVLGMFSPLELVDFALVDDRGHFWPKLPQIPPEVITCEYACGMFEFVKIGAR